MGTDGNWGVGALKRIEDGSYGLCEVCGMKIPDPRLEAIPYAALCFHCASQREQDNGLQTASASPGDGARAWISVEDDG